MKKNLLYRLMRLILSPFTLGVVKKINGLENIPKNSSFIIVANHESYIDPLIIKEIFDKYFNKIVYYLTKKEFYNNFFKMLFFDSVGSIPIDRQKDSKDALDIAINKIKEGEIIGIFPEGTRSMDGKIQRGKTGAVRIALSAKCQILPIGINNTYEIWPQHKKLPKHRKVVIINIGKPVSLERYYNHEITKELLREITDKIIMPEIARLSNQDYDILEDRQQK